MPDYPDPRDPQSISRRSFLARTAHVSSVLSLGFFFAPGLPAQQTVDKSKLIVRSANPQNLETPVQLLNTWITPNELFYVRSHADTPRLDLKEWRLQVDGEVNQSLS